MRWPFDAFKARLLGDKLAARTINMQLALLEQLLRFADRGYARDGLARWITFQRKHPAEVYPFAFEEKARFLTGYPITQRVKDKATKFTATTPLTPARGNFTSGTGSGLRSFRRRQQPDIRLQSSASERISEESPPTLRHLTARRKSGARALRA